MTGFTGRKAFAMLASSALISWTAGTAYAQSVDAPAASSSNSSDATVTGRVYIAESGHSLRGAIVRVVGTNAQDYTTEDGRFKLSVPIGSSELEVQYVGLDTLRRTVVVERGTNAVANFAMESASLKNADIVVRAAAFGQALAINQQKTASGIVNIVSEEAFGAMPDGNIGYALQRLPGLSVNTDQSGQPNGVNIRGIESDYNSFQIDGNRLPTSGGGRGFSTAQFAADGIANIEVIKAPTPDRDGDAIGGIVNVISRSAFERSGREIKVAGGSVYSDLPEKFGHTASLKFSDIFSVGGGDRNLGISATLSNHRTNRYSLNRDMDWVVVTPENNPALGLDKYDEPVWFMESSHWEYDTRVTKTTTANLAVDFRTDPFNSFYLRGFYSNANRRGVRYETDIDIDTRFQDRVGGRKTYAELTPDSGRGTAGNNGSRGSRGWIGTEDDRKTDLYSINFGGRHEGSHSLLTYDLFHSRSKQTISDDNELSMLMQPKNPWLVFEYEVIDPSRGEVIINQIGGGDPTDLSLISEGELIITNSWRTEKVFTARADWERRFDLGDGVFTFKTGGKYHRSDAIFDQTANVYSMGKAFPYVEISRPSNEVIMSGNKYFDMLPSKGVALLQSRPELFKFEAEDSLEDSYFRDYDATEKTKAGYAMGTYRSGIHMILGGVRYEHVGWKNTNYQVSYLDGAPSFSERKTGDSYGYWLPGLHLRHELLPNLILRESYNKSYGRPRLSELTEGRFVDEDGDITDGNPNLKPATSQNFDAQLEYYTDSGGLYSVGLFYKKVKNFSFTQEYKFNILDANGIPIRDPDGDLDYEVPMNGTAAQNYGIELIARQRLSFLPGPLSGLSTSLSATFADTEADFPNRSDERKLPLPGFSDFLFTGTLEWAWKGFNLRGDYIYRKDYVQSLGDSPEDDDYYAAEQRVDLSASYSLRNGFKAKASVINLTNEAQAVYVGYRQFVKDANISGRKFTFSVEYAF